MRHRVPMAATGTSTIRTEGLTKTFGALTAVDHLDLEVRRGEVFGFLGPNGAGKTTTIRLLLDLLRPTSGTASVLGGSGADPAVRARIGYLPAELPVPPRYSGRDLVGFFGRIRGGVDEARVAMLAERFSLDLDRPSGQLSTGNKRKVGILAAFAHRTELLILDEPTSGLDPLLQHEFHALVREVVADGTTVLLSSHVLPEVKLLADRVGILREGRLVAMAAPGELQARTRHRIRLTLEHDVDASRTFSGVAGVVGAEVTGREVLVVVDGSVDAVLKAVATLPVAAITTDQDDLEDAFLGFYDRPLAP
jgi:ABC-2 type transport system ATP-binding protein